MTTGYKGRNVLLKVGDGATSETFASIGAAQVTQMTLNNSAVDITNTGSSGYRELLAGVILQSMTVSVQGIMDASANIETVEAAAAAGVHKNYQLTFENGDKYESAFRITQFQRGGRYDGEETFSATFESTGTITRTPGS